jgi:hypothetical protein
MLSLKNVNAEDLLYYIKIAFEGDLELKVYYDNALRVRNLNNMCSDTYAKIVEYYEVFPSCEAYSVVKDDEGIGYMFISKDPNRLISFGLNKEHRNGNNLKMFFKLISKKLKHDFECILHTKNDRAINWLIKCGMDVDTKRQDITILKFKELCQ